MEKYLLLVPIAIFLLIPSIAIAAEQKCCKVYCLI